MNRASMLRLARLLYIGLLLVAFAWLIATRRSTIATLIETAHLGRLLLAWLASFGLIWWGSAFWSSATRSLGQPVPIAMAISASCRSLLARYIPGSVWYAVGRVGLLTKHGFDPIRLTTTAAIEIAMSIVVVFSLGTAVLSLADAIPGGTWWLLPSILVALLALSGPAINRLLSWWSQRKNQPVLKLDSRSYLRLALWMGGYWTWAAGTFSLYMTAFPDLGDWPGLRVAGSFMIAWGTGFLAPIAPQGLGVFEATLTALLGAATDVLLVVAGYRALLMLRDVLANLVAEVATQRASTTRRESPPMD